MTGMSSLTCFASHTSTNRFGWSSVYFPSLISLRGIDVGLIALIILINFASVVHAVLYLVLIRECLLRVLGVGH